jgi:predicted regulator of Ras-like GTPase activity (Roadblock/LC7/MglB family)
VHPEDALTIDEAIRDLLDVSTDIAAVAILDASGAVVACGPGAADERTAEAVGLLWDAASRRAAESGDGGLEHVVVPVAGGVVAVVEAHGHRAVAVTGPRPAVALLLFDLRTCLGDAFGAVEDAQ